MEDGIAFTVDYAHTEGALYQNLHIKSIRAKESSVFNEILLGEISVVTFSH